MLLPDPSMASFPILINEILFIKISEKSESIASLIEFLKTEFLIIIFLDLKIFK